VFLSRNCLRTAVGALTTTAVLAAGASSAGAGVLVASAPACDEQTLAKPFLPWLDIANYTPLSGADFESGADGWSLGASAVANGNEPWRVGGAEDAKSLALPSGASATSPAICVGLNHPTIRFFAKRRSGGTLSRSTLRVNVLFETANGNVASLPIGLVRGGRSWQVTSPMLVVANLLPLLPGEQTPVRFRFTAQGANWSIDDVWVDPYGRR